jgi:PPOX class probable F420-dependent enzyme
MVDIDTSTEFGARVARHLEEDLIVWLTTVDPDLTPQPSPVWFLWEGETALIYSQPNTPKLGNIADRPRASLNFNCTDTGTDVVILTGEAWIEDGAPPATGVPAYIEKYSAQIAVIGMTPESFAQSYSVAVRVRPTALRGM